MLNNVLFALFGTHVARATRAGECWCLAGGVCCGDRRNVCRWDSHDGLTPQQFMNKPYNAHKRQGYFVLCSSIRTRGRSMRLSIPWMLQAISYIAIAIFLFNAYKSKRQKYIKFLALFFLVFGLVAFLILVISAITQMFFR